MAIHLPNARFVFSNAQTQRMEAAALKLPPERRPAFREAVKQAVRVEGVRSKVTDANLGIAISHALSAVGKQ
jgi:hypothetical protein